MIKEGTRLDLLDKKGSIHTLQLKKDPSQLVKIFEKKINYLDNQKLFLHIGLKKLPFGANFVAKQSLEQIQELSLMPQFQGLTQKELIEKVEPSYSLGDPSIFSLSKYPLKEILENDFRGQKLKNKVILLIGNVYNEPYVNQLQNVVPYAFLGSEFKQREYVDIISDKNLYESIILDKESYIVEQLDKLDPKLQQSLDLYFESVLSGLELKWLHFQSLLWCIEDNLDKYEDLKL